jgi:phosphoribosylformylglycinamidine synthase II
MRGTALTPGTGNADTHTLKTAEELGLNLTASEIGRLTAHIGRRPTVTELFLFDVMWSEHCSYKSSRALLKKYLPTGSARVILGPGEDAGVVRLAEVDGVSYVLVVAHESHNHPSQIIPVEGAATGIGGIVRDVYCMGADVVGVMDALRFGDPAGPNAERTREIVDGVVRGIWEYGNALGVPNVGGDVYFDSRYDDNCLVNVVALGVAREDEIIRSRVPAEASTEPYVFVLVGKPTDMSGLGGATMASRILDGEVEGNVGAVQIHDPFLKRMLTEANKAVLRMLRERGVPVGFKDLGAGGIACATSEMAGAGGFGAKVDLEKVHVAVSDLEPYAIACSETQERYCLAVPSSVADDVLGIYNRDFELPHIYRGARASVIGEVDSSGDYLLTWRGDRVVDVRVDLINEGISYERETAPPGPPRAPAEVPAIDDFNEMLLTLLGHDSICSRHYIYRHYDSEVRGDAILRPGEADAGVTGISGTALGIAASVDGNPVYCALDPYQGAMYAVCESVRNVAAAGALPVALTDCLNFGNPEYPSVFRDFEETVRGIGDAARALSAPGSQDPVPVVSGNVSFYNESHLGSAVPPSPIVACYGVIEDYSRAVSICLKRADDALVLVGRRKPGLGGSALLAALGRRDEGRLAELDLAEERNSIYAVAECIRRGRVVACHDISDGGLAVALAEMVMGGWAKGSVGAEVSLDFGGGLSTAELLFGENGGFVMEVPAGGEDEVKGVADELGAHARVVGRTTEEHRLVVKRNAAPVIDLDGGALCGVWQQALERGIR